MLTLNDLSFRRIDPAADADIAYAHHCAACAASYGSAAAAERIHRGRYLRWLADRIDEFPDGHVLVLRDEQIVGQLDCEAPYGLPTGYINLFFVREPFRRQGLGRRMHDEYALRYFRSWEVRRIDLHVTGMNEPARWFYHRLGYRPVRREGNLYRMRLELTGSA
jgi:ribosomal protein S18 acetylase RimI-like enzyme